MTGPPPSWFSAALEARAEEGGARTARGAGRLGIARLRPGRLTATWNC